MIISQLQKLILEENFVEARRIIIDISPLQLERLLLGIA